MSASRGTETIRVQHYEGACVYSSLVTRHAYALHRIFKCGLSVGQTLYVVSSETLLILRRIQRDIITLFEHSFCANDRLYVFWYANLQSATSASSCMCHSFYLLYVLVTTLCLHNARIRDALHRSLKYRKTTQVITVMTWPNIPRTAGSFGGV